MELFIKDNLLFAIFVGLFIIEQISIFLMLPYPCRYGLKVQTLKAPRAETIINKQALVEKSSLAMRAIGGSECFFRYKYPPLVGGPYIFVAQIQSKQEPTTNVRVGFITLIFIVYPIFRSVILDRDLYWIINVAIFGALVFYFYLRFTNSYWRFMEKLVKAS